MQLQFKYEDRKYNLRFNRVPVMQIVGDSPSGKSLMCHDIRELQATTNECDNILVLDERNIKEQPWTNTGEISDAVQKQYKYIVIDNADVILNMHLQLIIMSNPDIHWIIIGRNEFMCVPGLICKCVLKNDNNNITVSYDW